MNNISRNANWTVYDVPVKKKEVVINYNYD